MEHIAILNPKKAKIEDILCGDKTIESRWYKHRVKLWNNIRKGEKIYFKESGDKIKMVAVVVGVLQFENISKKELNNVIEKYKGKKLINLKGTTPKLCEWASDKKYIILIFLKNPKKVIPFDIDKTGFGNAAAWLCIQDINKIKK